MTDPPSAQSTPLPSAAAIAAALEATMPPRPDDTPFDAARRPAAVAVVLFDAGSAASILLTKRSDDLPSHPGQVSLPGGVLEPEDPTPRDAALRETEEELGIPASALRVVGTLPDMDTATSGFVVRPFVAHMVVPVPPVPSDAEVARVMVVPLSEILAADARLPERPGRLELRYPLDGEDVWGATAWILRSLCRALRRALSAPGAEGRGATPAGAGPDR
ncbi:MAG: CoA pyrophosphatase [Thermoleophilia bacterium]